MNREVDVIFVSPKNRLIAAQGQRLGGWKFSFGVQLTDFTKNQEAGLNALSHSLVKREFCPKF
jgi:hypothetical protein